MRSHKDHENNFSSTGKPLVPSLHYIWIGPPNIPGIGVPGHDVAGPIEMAKANKVNPLFFWCLDEHVNYYCKIFADYDNIKVCSIQAHIEDNSENPEMVNSVKYLKEIIDTCLNQNTKRGTIRDRISVKVAFSLFLLHSESGYVLDTNILTLQDEVALPKYETFRIPVFNEIPTQKADLEFWMMYSPARSNNESKEMLNNFYLNWQNSEVFRQQHGPSQEYYLLMTNVMPLFEEFQKGTMQFWVVEQGENSNSVIIKELGLVKNYSNTHKFEMRGKYDQAFFSSKVKDQKLNEIFTAAAGSSEVWLRSLIRYGADINERLKKSNPYFYIGETPLHIAVRTARQSSINNVKLLLEEGANPDLPALYPGNVKVTARSLMQGKPEYVDMLAKYDAEKRTKGRGASESKDELEASSKNYIHETLVLEFIRLLSQLAAVREVRGDTERRTGMYTLVHEDSSTVSTKQLSTAVEFRKKSIEANRGDWEEALSILSSIPPNQLLKFLKVANLKIQDGMKLVDYAEETSNDDLMLALAQVNANYFIKKPDTYYINLYNAINTLKNNQLFNEKFLRKAILLSPERAKQFVDLALALKDRNLLQNDRISKVFIEHPDEICKLSPILIKLNDNDLLKEEDIFEAVLNTPQYAANIYEVIVDWELGELAKADPIRELVLSNIRLVSDNFRMLNALRAKNLFHLWREEYLHSVILSNPTEIGSIASICIKFNEANQLGALPLLLKGTNIGQRIKIGLMLLSSNLVHRLDELEHYELLEPKYAERLINALSYMKMMNTPFAAMYQDKEDLDQLIRSVSEINYVQENLTKGM